MVILLPLPLLCPSHHSAADTTNEARQPASEKRKEKEGGCALEPWLEEGDTCFLAEKEASSIPTREAPVSVTHGQVSFSYISSIDTARVQKSATESGLKFYSHAADHNESCSLWSFRLQYTPTRPVNCNFGRFGCTEVRVKGAVDSRRKFRQ